MMSSLASRWRVVSFIAALSLLILVFGWRLSKGVNTERFLLALTFSLPAMAPLFGLWRGKVYTFRWASLCALPYFIVGITEVVANPSSRPWSAFVLAGSLVWFFALIAFLRVTQRESAQSPSN